MPDDAKKEGRKTPDETSRVPVVPVSDDLSDDQLTGVSGGRALRPMNGQRPTKWTGPTLSGKGTDVAMEELELSKEKLTPD